MRFPIHLHVETGEELLASLSRARNLASRKGFQLRRKATDLLNENEALFNQLAGHFDDLDWIYGEIARSYEMAAELAKKFAEKLDGTDKAQATREDITAVMEYESAVNVAATLIRHLLHTFATELAPQLEAYPDLNKQILEIVSWS